MPTLHRTGATQIKAKNFNAHDTLFVDAQHAQREHKFLRLESRQQVDIHQRDTSTALINSPATLLQSHEDSHLELSVLANIL